MAEAAVECPEGTVREVLYPVVSEQRLRDLVKEYRASGPTYRHQVYTILRASYSGHYRRMLPPLLEALDFRTTSTAYRPIITALELLKAHRDSRQQYLTVDGSLPIDGVIPAQWLDLVLEQDAKGLMRVNRMNYDALSLIGDKVAALAVIEFIPIMVYWASHERRHHRWPVYGSPMCRPVPQNFWI